MKTPPTTTGKEICKARRAAGMVQLELAEYLRVGQPFIADLESDRTQPSSIRIQQICKICKCEFRVTSKGYLFEPGG